MLLHRRHNMQRETIDRTTHIFMSARRDSSYPLDTGHTLYDLTVYDSGSLRLLEEVDA